MGLGAPYNTRQPARIAGLLRVVPFSLPQNQDRFEGGEGWARARRGEPHRAKCARRGSEVPFPSMSATCAEREPSSLRALATHAYGRALTRVCCAYLTSTPNSESGLLSIIEYPHYKTAHDRVSGGTRVPQLLSTCLYALYVRYR